MTEFRRFMSSPAKSSSFIPIRHQGVKERGSPRCHSQLRSASGYLSHPHSAREKDSRFLSPVQGQTKRRGGKRNHVDTGLLLISLTSGGGIGNVLFVSFSIDLESTLLIPFGQRLRKLHDNIRDISLPHRLVKLHAVDDAEMG